MSARVRLVVVAVSALLLGAAGPVAAARVDPDGGYRGRLVADNVADSGTIHFTVAGDGSRVTGWRVTMNVVCASLPVRVELITQTMPAMKVGSDGRFRGVYTKPTRRVRDVRIVVAGRLSGTRVRGGTIDYRAGFSTGTCTRTADWTAARLR